MDQSNAKQGSGEQLEAGKLDIFVNHLLVRGIKNEKVVHLLLEHDRENFLPQHLISVAESDGVIYYSKDSFVLDRASAGMMLNLLQDAYLDSCAVVGAKVGYLSTLLSSYFNNVIAIENNEELSKQAVANFDKFGLKNINILSQAYDDISLPQEQDVIFIEGAFEEVNPSWVKNLKINGCIIGYQRIRNISKLVSVVKINKEEIRLVEFSASAVPLLSGLNNKEKFIF